MSTISQKIKQVRPKLRVISPISAAGIAGFAVFNCVLGTALAFEQARTVEFFIVNEVFSYQVWGGMFVTLGLYMGISLLINSWRNMRWSLLIAIFLKLWWFMALVAREFIQDGNNNLMLIIMWSFITYLQLVLYVNFIPKGIEEKGE